MKKTMLFVVAIVVFMFFVVVETIFEEEISQSFQEDVTTIQEEVVTSPLHVEEEYENKDLFIGLTKEEIIAQFGEPTRKDPSAYGYEWWIYPEREEGYVQIGIENDRVVTAFVMKREHEETYAQLKDEYDFLRQVELKNANGHFSFELTEEDVKMRPLVEKDRVWIQFYFDTHTGYLSSVRLMNEAVLLRQLPYSITYRGELPEEQPLSKEEWEAVERGEAQQIFAATNVIRERHALPHFEWDDRVAHVAYLHSREMRKHGYFSHTSPLSGELQDRLEKGNILFQLAGENIAAQYVDGVAAVEGWLNSEGHRINLLHEEFTHLGVGVYEQFYTQNFLIPIQLP